MRASYFFLLLLSTLMCACKKDEKVPEPVAVVSEKEYTDTTKITLSANFESYLIKQKIDPVAKPDGFILYQYIKNIDTLILSEPIGASTLLNGIEGFQNLRYFSSQGLKVDTLDFSHNNKLEYFEYKSYPHCMDCTMLRGLNFGKTNSIKHINLANSLVKSLDTPNMKLLHSVKLFSNSNMADLDLSGCKELRSVITMGAVSNLKLGEHPNLEEMECGTEINDVKISSYPALKRLHIYCSAVAELDLSKLIDLEEAYIREPGKFNIDLTKSTKLKRLMVDGQGKWNQTTLDLSRNVDLRECRLFGTKLKTVCVASLSMLNSTSWETDSDAEFKICQ
jgi:hypothetical protein